MLMLVPELVEGNVFDVVVVKLAVNLIELVCVGVMHVGVKVVLVLVAELIGDTEVVVELAINVLVELV